MDVKPSDVNTSTVAGFALGGLLDSQVLTFSKVVIFQHFLVPSEENNTYFLGDNDGVSQNRLIKHKKLIGFKKFSVIALNVCREIR